MCASMMFNPSIDPSSNMDFELSVREPNRYFFSTSPTFNSIPHQFKNHGQLANYDQFIEQNLNSNHNLLSNPNSRSPTYSPMTDDLKNNFRKKAKQCLVCGEAAFYFFYGSLCCDACRTFFRRSSLQNSSKNLKCPFNGKCVINNRTRKDCSKCRLDKCLGVGMRQDLIVNAKEERKRKQSINLYDFPFNGLNSTTGNSSNNTSNFFNMPNNSFPNNFGFSAIQNEYDQYLQSCLNYANAYYMHNNLNGFNENLLNSVKVTTNNHFCPQQTSAHSSSNTLDTLNSLNSLNSLNQLKNYPSPANPFLFNNENSNSSLDTVNYLSKNILSSSAPQSCLHHLERTATGIFANSSLDKCCRDKFSAGFLSQSLQSNMDQHTSTTHLPNHQFFSDHLTNQLLKKSSSYQTLIHDCRLDCCFNNRLLDKESKGNFSFLNKLNELDSEETILNKIRNLTFAGNDDNAKDGFNRYINENDFDKIDSNKKSNKFSSSLSSLSSCSSYTCSASQPNCLSSTEQKQPKFTNNYNWKKRKIQHSTDDEIEKSNRKLFRTLSKQNQLIKKQRLEEVIKASKCIMKKPDYKLSDMKLNEGENISKGHLLEALKWQIWGVTKLAKAFQEITAYKKLDETEKKYLLMANCTYILMLSSTKYYNFKNQTWDINVKLNEQEKRIKMPVSVEVMNNGSKKDLALFYIKFMEIFDRSWLEDEILMSLIFVICLFIPDEKLIKKIKNIKYEYECYLCLLEDYLEKKLKCKEKVESHTGLIKIFLDKLIEFKEMFETVHVVLAKEEKSQLYSHLTEQLTL